MKIAIFASAFHPSLGGVEELCRQISHELIRTGNEVIVITERWPRDLPAHEQVEGISVYRFPMRVPNGSWKARLSYALTHHFLRSQMASVVKQFGADVLQVQCVSSATWYALHVQRVLGLPLVVTLQGELSMDAAGIFQREGGIAQRIMRQALAQADAVTACSQFVLDEAIAFFGRPLEAPCAVIPNGIRLEEFEGSLGQSRSCPYVFAIGRHVLQKGFDLLLRAWAALGDLGYDLVLAGDGPENRALKELSQELGIVERVSFVGRTNRKETAAFFTGCTFFVLPSRHEPFGIVNLEAMAAGKPVVATAVGGVSEVVQDKLTGVLTSPEPEALAEAMRNLLQHPDKVQSMGWHGAQRVRSFTWRTLVGRYLAIYQACVTAVRSNRVDGRVAASAKTPLEARL